MGTISHVALCLLFLYTGVSDAMFDDKSSAEDPLGFEEVNSKFADVFVKKVLENKDFKLKDDNDDDLKEVVNILVNSIKKLKNLGDADEVEKRAIMNAFATGIATVILDHTDSSEYSPEKKTAIVVDAMRDAFKETGQKPSESLIGDVEFMTGVLLSLQDEDSSSDDSDDSEPEVTTTTPKHATSLPPEQDTTEKAQTGSSGSDESSQSSSRSPSSSSSLSSESSSESVSSQSESSPASESSQSESSSVSESSQSESSGSNSSESDLQDSAPIQTDPTPEPGHQFPKDVPSKPSGTVKPLSADGTGPVGKIGPYGDLGPIEQYGTLSDIGPMDNIGPKGKLHVYPHTPGGNIIIMSSDKKKPRHKSTPAKAATGSTLSDKSSQQKISTPSTESQGPTPTPPESITTAKDPITGPGDQIPQNKPASSGGNDSPIPSNGSGPSEPPSVTSAQGVTTALPDQASDLSSEFVPTQPPATNSAPNDNKNANAPSEQSTPSPSPSKVPDQKSESSSTQAPISANIPKEKQNLQDSAPGDSTAPSSDNIQSSEGQETASAPSANTADSSNDPLQNKGQRPAVSDESTKGPEPSKTPEQKSESGSKQVPKSGNDPEENQDFHDSSSSCCGAAQAPESNPLGNTAPSESNPDEDELFQDATPDQSSNQVKSPSRDSPQKPGEKPLDSSVVPESDTAPKPPEPSKAPIRKAASGTPQAPESNPLGNTSHSESNPDEDEIYQDANPEDSNQENDSLGGSQSTSPPSVTSANPSTDSPQKPGAKPLDAKKIPVSNTSPADSSTTPSPNAATDSNPPVDSSGSDELLEDASPNDSDEKDSYAAEDDENERPQGAFPQQTPGWGSGSKPPPGPTMLDNVGKKPQGPQVAGRFISPELKLRSTGPSVDETSSNNDQFLPFGDFIKIFNATMHGGNKRNPYYVNTILKSKKSKPGTLNYRELVKALSAMFGAMRYDHQLPFSDLYVQMLLELLYASLDIIRSSDSSCLHHPKGDPQIREYARVLYDVLI